MDPGEFVALMGPSGAGKTTWLDCLSGLDDITAGSVAIAGEDLEETTDARRPAQRARDCRSTGGTGLGLAIATTARDPQSPFLGVTRAGDRRAPKLVALDFRLS